MKCTRVAGYEMHGDNQAKRGTRAKMGDATPNDQLLAAWPCIVSNTGTETGPDTVSHITRE